MTVLLLLIASWLLAKTGIEYSALPERSYNRYQCLVDNAEAQREIKVLDSFLLNSDDLADLVCDNTEAGRYFNQVSIFWQHRDSVDLRSLLDLEYSLFLAKPELLQRIELVDASGYVAVASHPSYTSGLLSLGKQPELTNDYFRGKVMGLIDDPSSLSGYQIPKAAFHKNMIDESLFKVRPFKSHNLLYEALLTGEVDLIASYLPGENDPLYERLHVLSLMERLVGPRWYLHPDLIDSAEHCILVDALKQFSKGHINPYIEKLTIIRECAYEE